MIYRGPGDRLDEAALYLMLAEESRSLALSRKAVEYHLGNIYAKCGLPGRQQLRRFVEQWRQPAAI